MALPHLIRSSRFPARKLCSPSLPRRPAAPQTRLIPSILCRNTPIGQGKLQETRPVKYTRPFHSSLPAMASTASELKQTLTPTLLDEVRNFWFSHFCSEDALVLPGQSDMMKWFSKDAEFDKACVSQFQPALEAILDSGASATDILDSIDQESPMNWLSLVILLDQVPRNCYRGDESKLVFTRLDPLAQDIALRAIEAGIPSSSSQIRYRLAYRFWFHLPLMHSESLAVHEKAVQVHEETAKDLEDFLLRDVADLDSDEKICHDLLSAQKDVLRGYLSGNLDFEERHKVIIERFGRYPHRNQAMGRESTKEEVDYLENGGETFG